MDSIESALKSSGCDYELILHENPIHTAQEGADYFTIEIGQTAPTLILKTDKGYLAVTFSGDRKRVDFAEIANLVGCKHVQLATKKEVKQITGCEIGSVPMVGLALPFVLDKQLLRYPFVYGGSGQANRTLKIAPNALQQLNNVVVVWG
ncbi:MAG: YbaK/prolyl-tRNA synthetase associated region [Firmicutes bacterium]|nr:YbaK/prolyl-tRNA synthetase associated region [Bacillota bacterium]